MPSWRLRCWRTIPDPVHCVHRRGSVPIEYRLHRKCDGIDITYVRGDGFGMFFTICLTSYEGSIIPSLVMGMTAGDMDLGGYGDNLSLSGD